MSLGFKLEPEDYNFLPHLVLDWTCETKLITRFSIEHRINHSDNRVSEGV